MIEKSRAFKQATEAAKVYTVDEKYREAFMKGAEWAIGQLMNQIRPDCHEGLKGYPHDLMEKLTLKGLRKMFFEWIEKGEA